MIQDIFLPEKIGSYYLFRQRIIGVDITKSHVHAARIIAQGASITIEKQISSTINGEQANHDERTITTLQSTLEQMGTFDSIRTALPSSLVVFKELRLPFTTRNKISLVLPFEVAPLLPFPAHDAEIDFIITSVNKEEQSAQVLVAAAQKKHIAEHISLFDQAGYKPDTIVVDMFALYGVFHQIPSYQSPTGTTALIDLGMHSTSIIAIRDNQLRIVRTLPFGLSNAIKDAGTSADLKPQQVLDHIIRFGIQKEGPTGNNEAILNSLTAYLNKIQFALTSTFSQLQVDTIDSVVLSGTGADIKDIASFCEKQLNTTCEIFDIQNLKENKQYHFSPQFTPSQAGLLSVAIGLPTPALEGFNVLTGEFAPSEQKLLLKQMIVSLVLVVMVFATLITQTIIQSRRLQSEIDASQEETIEALKERFEISEDMEELDEVVQDAQAQLDHEVSMWRPFSSQTRASFLEYLLELTSRINKQELGFVPKEISFTDGAQGEITVRASVRDWQALTKLEQALRESKLFKYAEGQSDTENYENITMKFIVARK
jgi:type IV pilus assembly protein PilM